VAGTVADAHNMSGLSHLAAVLVGLTLGLVIAMLSMAYRTGVRVPSLGRKLAAMVDAMEAGQAVSGRFQAALREILPGLPHPRWKRGQVVITPQSVLWVRRMTKRPRDLTGAQCTGERQPDPGYIDMTLTLPSFYKGENVHVITLHANGTDMELAAPARLLEILRYSLARLTVGKR